MAASTSPALAVPVRYQARIVGLMFALSATSYLNRIVISIAGPTIMKEYGITETQMGTVFSAFLVTYTLMMTPGGALADRFGGRLVLTIGGLGVALFSVVTSFCGPHGLGGLIGVVPAFVVARLAFGACAAPLYPSTGRIAASWFPASAQARVQAIIMGAAAVGSAVTPILGAHIIRTYGWQAGFWFAAAVMVVLIAFWYMWVRDHPPGVPAPERRVAASSGPSWGTLFADRHLLLLTLSYLALNYLEYIFYYWIYYYFGQIRHLSPHDTSIATTVVFITMAVMTPVGGWTSDWITARFGVTKGGRIVPIGAMALSAILLYVGASGFGLITTVVLLSLSVGFSMAPEGPFWSTAIRMGGKKVGAACGFMNTGGNVGGMLAPILTPIIAQRYGWNGGLFFASGVVMLGMLAWLLLDPAHRLKESAG
jgi:ACS family glucarate transporter-like MFS transporter